MDAADFIPLVDRFTGPLLLYARQWCSAPEDVVQEAFIKLATQRRPPDRVGPWLYRVVRNAAISAARSERRRKHHEGVRAAGTSGWFEPACGEVLDAAIAGAALAELPPEQREVIAAHLWGELTFDEIAELVGSSASTVYRRYAAGLAALREKLSVPCPTRNSTPG